MALLAEIYAAREKNSIGISSADLAEKYPEIPYWDYSHDEEFSPYIELFMDDDHLNLYGAEKFTARIIEDLKRADYLK